MFYIGSFTNDEIKLRIQKVYAQFVSDVDPDRLSDWLIQGNVLTIDEKHRIRNPNHAKTDRCRALLDHLLATQHPRSFHIVRQALQKENHYLLEYIDNQEAELGNRVQIEKQIALQGYCSYFNIISFWKQGMTTWEGVQLH